MIRDTARPRDAEQTVLAEGRHASDCEECRARIAQLEREVAELTDRLRAERQRSVALESKIGAAQTALAGA